MSARAFTIAFLVAKVGFLLDPGKLAGLGIEGGEDVLAGGDRGRRSGLLRRGRFIGAGGDVGGTEGFDAVLRAVRDPHLIALELALGLIGTLGEKVESGRTVGLRAGNVFSARRIFMRMVSLRKTRVSAELPGVTAGTDSATLLPVVTAL